MREGDLVLTPPLCWHGHINESDGRTVWFDAANMPLVCNLDASFFEPGSRGEEAFWEVDEGDERLWMGAGMMVPGEPSQQAGAHSPKYHYPGEATRALLAAAPTAPDGSKMLRYVNPATGGAVMPSLDCYAMRLTKGAGTRARRSTANAIFLVVSGSGSSTVGDTRFGLQKHDVFTIPHWTWASHTAAEGHADLFVVTDRSVYEFLGLLREEMR